MNFYILSETSNHHDQLSGSNPDLQLVDNPLDIDDLDSSHSNIRIAGITKAASHSDIRIARLKKSTSHSDIRIAGLHNASSHSDIRIAGLNNATSHTDVRLAGRRNGAYSQPTTPSRHKVCVNLPTIYLP